MALRASSVIGDVRLGSVADVVAPNSDVRSLLNSGRTRRQT